MVDGVEVSGTLRQSDCVMLEFKITQTLAIEQNQTSVSDFKTELI